VLNIDIKTKHVLAANLLLNTGLEKMKSMALSCLSSGIDFMPTILEFRATDIHDPEYLYAVVHYGKSYDDIYLIEFIDADGVDFAVKRVVDELNTDHSDAGFKTQRDMYLSWLSEYNPDEMTAF
jgi:hypothetical protein